MSELEIDPLEIDCWEQYCLECICYGKLSLFKKKLLQYLWLESYSIRKEYAEFINRRKGEIVEDLILTKKHGKDYRTVIAEKK